MKKKKRLEKEKVKLWKKAVVDKVTLVVFILVFILSVFTSVSPVIYVIGAAVAAVVLKSITGRKEGGEK